MIHNNKNLIFKKVKTEKLGKAILDLFYEIYFRSKNLFFTPIDPIINFETNLFLNLQFQHSIL
ncbi:hypothetical protein LEP1GSC132_1331 [Leptospira kirschneri str. 200803703]|nr:hypothetical protein LEP1GSC018_3577 [Leptospira kirschneri str. 2008720114]EKQ84715.1 hypothetical protein LEP1GSC064_2835 [Leptospira kirschneri serovar Grippotyphosa str. Moskva]EKR08547.1 hypothetical protein LEP1GSC122_1702 [Leptospira kirschneri serovar Valbuzzi str. 200702274]EMK14209.1 hypothetical protein LEP1GSC042_0464 [Leptospira kirschneri serovar Bim str. PUO 1247]EMN06158.1 hypothetical protein LEP1GSC046_2790 [Leptospira kirschneri serovar Bim str. 1051]EMN26461.1 hypothetic